MMRFKQIINVVLILFGVIAIGALLWEFSGFSDVQVMVVLICLFLGFAQLTSHIARQKERTHVDQQIEDLGEASASLARDLQTMQATISGLEKGVESAINEQNEKVISQMRVVESLVRQSTHGEAGKGRPKNTSVDDGVLLKNTKQPSQANDEAIIDLIHDALAGNKIGLYLQPIVTLPQRKTRFYEEFSYLRTGDDSLIKPSTYVPLAEKAGLMPMVNNLTMLRAIQTLRRLKQRNSEIGMFCNISVSSLRDGEFFPHFLEFIDDNQDLSDSIVVEFPQMAIRAAGPLEHESLTALAKRGISFSLDHVNDLNINFQELSDRGFRFLKLEASILLNGMEQVNSPIQGEDLHVLLERHGIGLIVDNIADERMVANVLDYDITLGQGNLFSEPRKVNDEAADQKPQSKTA